MTKSYFIKIDKYYVSKCSNNPEIQLYSTISTLSAGLQDPNGFVKFYFRTRAEQLNVLWNILNEPLSIPTKNKFYSNCLIILGYSISGRTKSNKQEFKECEFIYSVNNELFYSKVV